MIKPLSMQDQNLKIEELKGLNKRVAEIEWLLVALVILYIQISGFSLQENPGVLIALGCFTLFIIMSHYIGLDSIISKSKLTIDTWAMIAFISFILWNTGKIESPLLSLYLLVIITACSTLGEVVAFLEVGLISAICFLLSFTPSMISKLTLIQLSGPFIQLFPFWLTAYVTIKLSKENAGAKEKIEELSQTDYLTGLYNMRIFMILMGQEIMRAHRFNHYFTIIIIDADNLKLINDRFGHPAGDRLIKNISETIVSNMRITDIVARYGGDEYIVLLPETTTENAVIAGERLRKKIASTPFTGDGEQVETTISIGYASYPEHGTEMNELIRLADKALLSSKAMGKNRSTVFCDRLS
jgi:diguanylate cyclase (GGDEF)-like protein